MGVLLFSFYPQMAAFLSLFYLPFSQILLFCLLHQFLEALVISKRIVSLSPYSGKLVGDSTKTQYYLAVRITVEKVLVCSYKAFGRWSYCPKKLENTDSGVRIQRHWLSCISTAGLIALFQTLAVLVDLWGFQVIGVFGISIHLPHLHCQLLPPENFDPKLLQCWPITELL